jgi:electron transfer flavoprotein beta subunit
MKILVCVTSATRRTKITFTDNNTKLNKAGVQFMDPTTITFLCVPLNTEHRGNSNGAEWEKRDAEPAPANVWQSVPTMPSGQCRAADAYFVAEQIAIAMKIITT